MFKEQSGVQRAVRRRDVATNRRYCSPRARGPERPSPDPSITDQANPVQVHWCSFACVVPSARPSANQLRSVDSRLWSLRPLATGHRGRTHGTPSPTRACIATARSGHLSASSPRLHLFLRPRLLTLAVLTLTHGSSRLHSGLSCVVQRYTAWHDGSFWGGFAAAAGGGGGRGRRVLREREAGGGGGGAPLRARQDTRRRGVARGRPRCVPVSTLGDRDRFFLASAVFDCRVTEPGLSFASFGSNGKNSIPIPKYQKFKIYSKL